MTVCMGTAIADGLEFSFRRQLPVLGSRPATSAPAPGLLAEPASILAVWTAAGPWIAGVVGRVPPALVRSVLSIARSELDFELVELVPLSVGALPLRYREQLLKALAGGNRLGPVHGGIIPSLRKTPREAGFGDQPALTGEPPAAKLASDELQRRHPLRPRCARARLGAAVRE